MEEEKIPKQILHTSFNRRLSVAKKLEGNMTTAKKNFNNFILQGGHDKGGIWQRVLLYFYLYLEFFNLHKEINRAYYQ